VDGRRGDPNAAWIPDGYDDALPAPPAQRHGRRIQEHGFPGLRLIEAVVYDDTCRVGLHEVGRIPAIVATRGLTLVNRSRGQRRAVRASSATEESVSAAQV
jgi:hypothetical protein